MADDLGPNGLVISAGKCAGPIPAKNRTSCGKSIRTLTFFALRIERINQIISASC